MVGQINVNLKQPENADKFHFNFYLNQAEKMNTTLFKMDLVNLGLLHFWPF